MSLASQGSSAAIATPRRHPIPSSEPRRKQETLLLGPQPHFNPSPNVHALQASPQTPALRELTPTSKVLWWAKKNFCIPTKPRRNPCDGGIKTPTKGILRSRFLPSAVPWPADQLARTRDCGPRFELAFPCLELPRSSELWQSLPAVVGCGAGRTTARPSSFFSHGSTRCSLGAHLGHLCPNGCRKIQQCHSNMPIYYPK